MNLNKRLLTALLCAALCLLGAARAEGVVYRDDDMSLRGHASRYCALAAKDALETSVDAWEGSGYYPCPACVPDESQYPGVEAWERGGTVLVRVPDAWIEARLAEESSPETAPEALLYEGGARDQDLARLLHGQAYLDLLEHAAVGGTQLAEALVPECAEEGLLVMSRRHLGAAWLLAVRPDKAGRDALAKSGRLNLPLRLWRLELKVRTYAAGALFEATEDTVCRTVTLELAPKKSDGEIALRRNDVEEDGYGFYIVADGDVCTLVYRERQYDGEYATHRRAELLGDAFWLEGYRDGEDAVFVCAVTEGELAATRESLYPALYAVPVWREDNGEPAAEAQLAEDYVPVSEAPLPDGTLAVLNAPEYPVGTPFISATLTRPEGGVAEYGYQAVLQRLHNGQWLPVGDDNLRGRVNGDENRIRAGWFCDSVNLIWPIERFGALEEGLYRVSMGDDGQGQTLWLEFRVREGAPDPALPETKPHRWPDFDFPAHAPAYADAGAYNSCADNTRLYHSSTKSTLLAGGVVYELRGIDDIWGWGIGSHYSLFAYPEGQPRRAAQLIEDIDHSDLRLWDLGDGLLLLDSDNTFYRCDLDGGNLGTLGRAFGEDIPSFFAPEAGEERNIRDALPVGDGLYLATNDGIWRTGLDAIAPELVYRAEDFIQNDLAGGRMVYAEGKLFIADGGIVALDTARRDADGLMPARRLTDRYDGGDGDCGLGYIVLNGRLYCWDDERKATVSMNLDGGDAREVSKERFWFSAVTPSGIVLALTGSEPGLFGDERTGAAFYFPADADDPAFDPDRCEKRTIAPNDYDYILGDALVHIGADGRETREPLVAIGQPAPALPEPQALAAASIGPGEDLSFLEDYVDAVRVGDWYLACVKATEPEEAVFDTATRNTTAPWALLNERGEVLAEDLYWWPLDYEWALHPRPFEGFEDGVDTAVLRVGQKYGLIDRTGRIAVAPEYDMIFGFTPGDTSTPAQKGGKWGCIDEAGNIVVPFVYDSSFARFENGCTVAERGGKQLLLGEDGTELLPPEFDDVSIDDDAAYGMARRGDSCLVFDRKGNILFERALGSGSWIYPEDDGALPFPYWDGGARKNGYLNPDGSEALPPVYDEAGSFDAGSGTAMVQLNGLWGLVGLDGSFVLPAEYEHLGALREGLRAAEKGGLWGYLDADGNIAIPFQFAWADDFENGYADAVPAGTRWEGEAPRLHGLIDPSGRWVIEPRTCDYIAVGPDGLAVVCEYENEAILRLTEDGPEEIFALPRYADMDGLLPHEDASSLAKLSGEKTLKKRVSETERLPHLDGEERLYPLYAAYVEAVYPKDVRYEGYEYHTDPVLTVSLEDHPWQRLADGEADLLFAAAPGPEDSIWATLAARGLEAELIPLCRDAVVFLANADNPVEDLSAGQLEGIYAGAIADWAQLGAAGLGEIIAYQGDGRGEARAAFGRVCPFEILVEGALGVAYYDTWAGEASTDAVPYRNLPNALGYALRSQCKSLPAGVRVLSVDGVAPTDENVESGAYPYAETLYAVVLKGNRNPNVRALLDWIQTAQARELAQASGFAALGD